MFSLGQERLHSIPRPVAGTAVSIQKGIRALEAQPAGEGGLRELDDLLTAVEQSNQKGILEGLPTREGAEVDFLGRLLGHLRSALIVAVCGADAPMLEASADERKVLAERAKRLGVSRLQIWLEELLAARERMRLLPAQARLALEVALLDLARPGGDWPLTELESRLLSLEARLSSGEIGRAHV